MVNEHSVNTFCLKLKILIRTIREGQNKEQVLYSKKFLKLYSHPQRIKTVFKGADFCAHHILH